MFSKNNDFTLSDIKAIFLQFRFPLLTIMQSFMNIESTGHLPSSKIKVIIKLKTLSPLRFQRYYSAVFTPERAETRVK